VIAVAALIVVVAITVARRRRAVVDAEAWPWLLAEIEARVLRGEGPGPAAVAAAAQGPPALIAAVATAVDGHPADAGGAAVLDALATATGDPRAARLHTAVVACAAPTARADRVLEQVRATERAAADARRARHHAVAPAASASWLLLAPLAPVVVGAVDTAPAVVLAVAAVVAWCSARRWLAAAVDGRTGRWRP
jgi:hypothetical protein